MAPYRELLRGDRPTFQTSHLQDLALIQLLALVLAMTAMVFLGV